MNVVVERAVSLVGGQTALARKLGVSQQLVWHWLNVAERVPAERVLDIERATNGGVSRHELRPDLYPAQQPERAA